jgi:hypothetical protein
MPEASLRWLRLIAIATGASCAIATVAHAVPVTYAFSMTASGSLGSTNFADTEILVSAVGDSNDVTLLAPGVPCNGLWNTTFTVSGVNSGSITSPLSIATNQGMQLLGLTRGSCGAEDPLWISGYAAEFRSYNLAAGIGPMVLGSPSPSGVYVSTSSGVLALTRIASMTFHATFGASVVPTVGLWWNPNESGSGYNLDVKHGVLVVTIFSYKANGEPQWYITSGPIVDNHFTGTLNKYIGGQCISCPYMGFPASAGNDGAVTIEFTSPASAILSLPGGRVTQIQPQAF